MIHGLDTGFWVALEHAEHDENADARRTIASLLANGDTVALVPQIVAEFLHVVTDPRRFVHPMDIAQATQIAERWWKAKEVIHIFPNVRCADQFFGWVAQYRLGRKRLLDTLFAATLHEAGITSILTTNPKDFAVFGVFTCITPDGTTMP
jgi:predicted nucleic acid-binding protein